MHAKAIGARWFGLAFFFFFKIVLGDFPSGSVVRNPPANAGDMGSIPGPEDSHMPQSN